MNGLIVFNSANDVVFQQFNAALSEKVKDIAIKQGLLDEDANGAVDGNIILQIFSPVINSQRIMHFQFDNTYASFECENGLNFTFGELLGCTFIKIGQKPVKTLKRHLGVAIALTRLFYGANIFSTQASSVQEELLSTCLECYEEHLFDTEQSMMLEALPHLLINAELKRTVRSTLDAALERLREFGYNRAHALMFVSHKFVSITSTKQALSLSAADLLFLALLVRSLQQDTKPLNNSVAVFLQGLSQDPCSGCVPCIAHLTQLEKGIVLIQIVEYANVQVASSIYDTFFVLQKIVSVQTQGDTDALKQSYECLKVFVKQSLDSLKRAKLKGDDLEIAVKKFSAKWENLRKMYAEFLKGFEREMLVRIESNMPSFVEDLKQLFTLSCCDSSSVALDQLPEVASIVDSKLIEVSEFLAVKAERNISIEAYLEDFPGLIHFMYINRSSGLMIAPDLRVNQLVPKEKLWSMVEFTRNYLKKGQTTVMWKDKTFNYSYFLWFEDQASGALKSVDLQQHFNAPATAGKVLKTQYEPGLLAMEYYQQLAEECFPEAAPGKIKCYELFCIHLGLVTATCAVEHSRRLVATIADVIGEDCF
ncbi:Hermansky-Pudlak syndrome 1 protein-like [Teleopsis dalmanni]|uniref:Hermansky-Pudlak syndrome 1 protein-like n=1 Tax=Teleopsis dalmanni TaxID=139649 RepID=UPI0018CDDC12|nr:Hermansky-Pudlak syndrome 1 protein-like [Teleopsis dalmanni]XP_037938373.1 Hermansky-Pudlak syndrome 1 protein-like [Teleopsis dalmanni]